MINEFKKFIARGNVIDLAVAVIIGGAFNKIIQSLVNDIIMPVLSVVVGRVDLKNLKLIIGEGAITDKAITINYGAFLQTSLDFLILALCVFMMIKAINAYKVKAEDPKDKEVSTPKDIELLSEIRDLLKDKESL